MEVKAYRAATLQEALQRVRQELGPEAAVLETREVATGIWGWLSGRRDVEVLASLDVLVESRWATANSTKNFATSHEDSPFDATYGANHDTASESADDFRARTRALMSTEHAAGRSLVEELCERPKGTLTTDFPPSLFQLFTDLIDAELGEELARELVERARRGGAGIELNDYVLLKARVLRYLEEQIRVTGPIAATPGRRRIVALVGPTGVGKTTTIAKLAANFRLREQRRVGLVTVDTYRIAAVDQLRTYADIIDLPMEVVATPSDMRAALQRLSNLDLVLLDTAGRSPQDESRLQELGTILEAAEADEVQLVLSSVASESQLRQAARRFARVGVTSLLVTKLDEAAALGAVFTLLRETGLPLSYVTNGQNVPDDMEVADRKKLARRILAGNDASVL